MKILIASHKDQALAVIAAAFMQSFFNDGKVFITGKSVKNAVSRNVDQVLYESFLNTDTPLYYSLDDIDNMIFDFTVIIQDNENERDSTFNNTACNHFFFLKISSNFHTDSSKYSLEAWRDIRDEIKEKIFRIYKAMLRFKADGGLT